MSDKETAPTIPRLALQIRNLAHLAWTDRKSAEYLFREIGKRAQKISEIAGTSEQVREFKPYMEDHEYYDHPDLLTTIERIANRGSVDDYTVAGIRAELRDALHNLKFKREQASPTPEQCPTCGSHSKNGYHAHHEDRTKRCYVKGMGRSDPWHSSPGTPKGTK